VFYNYRQRTGIAGGGILMFPSLELKINRITKAGKHFIDAAKQVKPEPMLIVK